MLRHGSLILLMMFALAACKPGIPRGVISRGKMAKILYDYHIAQALAEQSDSVEERRYAYVLAVFKKHGVTEAEFDSSMVWYCAHSYELRDIYTQINQKMELETQALSGSEDEFGGIASFDGDTVSLWREATFFHLQPTHTRRLLHVVAKADSASQMGDEYMWRFNANYIQRDGRRQAFATLVLRHEGDSVLTSTRTVSSDGRVEIRLKQADTLALRQADCYIYMPSVEGDAQTVSLIITEPMLVRMRRR